MSFNLTFMMIPDTSLADTPSIRTAPEAVSYEEATSIEMGAPCAVQAGPHTLVVDTTMGLEAPASPKDGTTVIMVSGVSDTYSIEVHGDMPRYRVESAGEIVEDEGEPHPAESALDEVEFSEDAHIEMFCRIAGITQGELWELEWFPVEESSLLDV